VSTTKKIRFLSLTCSKINSKWIKDTAIRSETLKPLHENIRKRLEYIGIGNCFLNRALNTQETRAKINKLKG
jgi:hypothetical protein